jgi:hypothetical protein
MLFLITFIALLCSLFFYCQALKSGMGQKRWACAGLMFGPFIWPMFCMKKRMKCYQLFGFNHLILNA